MRILDTDHCVEILRGNRAVIVRRAETGEAVATRPPEPQLSASLGALVDPTVRAIRDGVGAAEGADGTYVVTWHDGWFIGSAGYGLVSELEREGIRASVRWPWRVPVTYHRTIDPAAATAETVMPAPEQPATPPPPPEPVAEPVAAAPATDPAAESAATTVPAIPSVSAPEPTEIPSVAAPTELAPDTQPQVHLGIVAALGLVDRLFGRQAPVDVNQYIRVGVDGFFHGVLERLRYGLLACQRSQYSPCYFFHVHFRYRTLISTRRFFGCLVLSGVWISNSSSPLPVR